MSIDYYCTCCWNSSSRHHHVTLLHVVLLVEFKVVVTARDVMLVDSFLSSRTRPVVVASFFFRPFTAAALA